MPITTKDDSPCLTGFNLKQLKLVVTLPITMGGFGQFLYKKGICSMTHKSVCKQWYEDMVKWGMPPKPGGLMCCTQTAQNVSLLPYAVSPSEAMSESYP